MKEFTNPDVIYIRQCYEIKRITTVEKRKTEQRIGNVGYFLKI